jgi:hypothetical protein
MPHMSVVTSLDCSRHTSPTQPSQHALAAIAAQRSRKEQTVKHRPPFIAFTLAAGYARGLASEFGNVLSSTPVTVPFAVTQQPC